MSAEDICWLYDHRWEVDHDRRNGFYPTPYRCELCGVQAPKEPGESPPRAWSHRPRAET